MSDGTTVQIYAARIHKHNAKQVLDEAEACITRCTQELIVLAAHHPTAEECEGLTLKVNQLVGEITSENFKAIVAEEIIFRPDECEDELDVKTNCSQ
jgi:hypothetical protein